MRSWTPVVEFALALAFGLAAILTVVARDWIELLFHIDPDGGGGVLESVITVALSVLAVTFFLAVRREVRRPGQRHLSARLRGSTDR